MKKHLNRHFCCLLLLLSQTAWAQTRQIDPVTNKMGFLDANGQTIIPLEYDFLEPRFQPLMIARKGDFKGVLDRAGRVQIPFEYHDIQMVSKFFMVNKDGSSIPALGLLDSNGKVVLPLVYEYIGVLDSNLLAARLFSSKELTFFDGHGQALFVIEGAAVFPGFDEHSVLIERANRSHYWADRQGNVITPPLFENPEWSDGEFFILTRNARFGVVNGRGETVVPFQCIGLIPGNKGHFIVSDTTQREALLDVQGQTLIPPGKGNILRLGKQEGDAYFLRRFGEFESQYYAADGKTLLHEACNILPVITNVPWNKLPENRYERYDWVEVKSTKLRGFYRADGLQILPPKFNQIKYCTDRHPLLAFTLEQRADGYKDYGGSAFDLNGKPILSNRYFALDFTENPRFLIGQPTYDGLYGFLDLNAPESAEFVYKELKRMGNGYYTAWKGTLRVLLSSEGEELYSGIFSEISEPQRGHHYQFNETQGVTGVLIAVVRRADTAMNSWIGVNDVGRAYSFGEVIAGPPLTAVQEFEAPKTPASVDDNEVLRYEEAEKRPQFPGGEAALLKFMQTTLKYPAIAKENGVEGQIVLSFIVEKDGSLSDLKILRDIGGGCGQAALQMVSQMPKWEPGAKNGLPKRVRHTLPVRFKLTN